ncbi:MAG: hypothetical protein ACR2FY_09615 [Pirellulaceae bacterium]
MNENEKLHEQMWDLCYGLLSADEVAALHRQIKSDPAAARLYAEVRLQADLVASAAKVEDVSVTLSVPEEGRKVQPAAKSHSGTGGSPFKPSKSGRTGSKSFPVPSYRTGNWLAGLAATALIALIGYGFFAPPRQDSPSLDHRVVAYVYGNETLQSGLTQNLKVVAKNGRGEPMSASLNYRVYDADGKVALDEMVRTDECGLAQLNLRGSAVQPGAILKVQPQSDKQSGVWMDEVQGQNRSGGALASESPQLVVPLAAKKEPVTSEVKFDKDSYQPGETVRFRSHSWMAFSNQPAAPADDWKLATTDGRELKPSAIESRPEAGIASGEFELPADAPDGYYQLFGVNQQAGTVNELEKVAVGKMADFSEASDRRARMEYKENMDSLVQEKSAEKAVDQPDVKMQMAAKGKKELFALGAPPAPSRATARPTSPTEESPAAPAETKSPAPPPGLPLAAAPQEQDKAMKPRSGSGPKADSSREYGEREIASLRKQDALDGKDRRRETTAERGEVSGSILVRGDSLVGKVPEELARKKLLVVVRKANVKVASQEYHGLALDDFKAVDAKSAESRAATNGPVATPTTESTVSQSESASGAAPPTFTLPLLNVQLPPEADGELDVTLYDQSVEPARLVYRQQVNRPSVRGLHIDIEQKETTFTPQQELQIGLRATDHNGNAVPHSWFALRLVREDAVERLAEAASPAPYSRYVEDKTTGFGGGGGQRGRSILPGVSESFDSGKSEAKDAVAKKAPQDEAAKKADPEREAMESEFKLKKAQGGSAPAGPDGLDRLSSSAALDPDGAVQPQAEDFRMFRDSREQHSYFSEQDIPGEPTDPREVLLASNDALVQNSVRAEETAAQAARTSFQQMVGRVVLAVSAAALLLLGLLAILHRPAQAKVWVPAMAVVAGSFAVGCIWLINGKIARHDIQTTAAIAPAERSGGEFFQRDARPIAPAAKSEPLAAPGTDDLGPAAALDEMTANRRRDRLNDPAEKRYSSATPGGGLPAGGPLTPGGAGGLGTGEGGRGKGIKESADEKQLAEGKPGAAPQAAARPNERAPAPPGPRAEEDEKKMAAELTKNALPRAEPAKDVAEPKAKGDGQGAAKPITMKSALALSGREKRAKSRSLLWEPNLPANEKGEAELHVQLPAEEGDYVLIVDVQGPSGVGTVQKRIPVRVPPAASTEPAAPAKP